MRYDAVLFDLDGTLTNSEPGIINSVKYALEKSGRPLPPDDVLRTFIGPPLTESFCRVCGMTEEEALQTIDLFRERFSPVGWKENSVFPGIAPLMRTLHEKGVFVAVATSKPVPFARRILDWFCLSPYVNRLEGVSMNERYDRTKADLIRGALSDGFRRACMVGDRKFDTEGAQANGIDSVGVLYGFGTREELEAAGTTKICETVDELTDYLLDGEAPLPGPFVTFEGGDGCGKSTQLRLAADYLRERGWRVTVTREPGGNPVSERIRDILLDVKSEGMTAECEALLFAAARAQHVRETIRPALSRGEAVLCDRYIDSSLVYQGIGRGLGVGRVLELNALAIDGLMPDLTLWYDLDPQTALSRRAQASELDRMEREKHEFLVAVHDGFADLAARSPERIRALDASRPIGDIQADTCECLAGLLASYGKPAND